MAPLRASAKSYDISSVPLAEFFWIAGLDGSELLEKYVKLGDVENFNGRLGQGVGDTIEEDEAAEAAEAEASSLPTSPMPVSPRPLSRHSKRNSQNRLSHLSSENLSSPRASTIHSSGTASNRSSATIRPTRTSSLGPSKGLSEDDFDDALRRFAADRESFFLDLNLSAGAVTQTGRPKPRPRTQRITAEDAPNNSLRSSIGSVRRHMSVRGMNSMKRQSTTVSRQASVRTSRRTSNYNSVIPAPEPLSPPPNMHPLKQKLEPVLLDRYPLKGLPDASKGRGEFPDYVPMFAFPNDINVVSADTRPRSTWHGFSMTAGDNSKLHGICVIVWVPMNINAADELEKRCEEWRKANMTDAERELAASLGERLASERAKLSRLLALLPNVASGSVERDELEEEIGTVEEKITMMSEILRPVRHGAASKIEGLTDGDTGFWIPRAYGILGKDSSMTSFWKEWLKATVVPMSDGAILRVPPSSPRIGMWQPLERYVINLCTEAPSPISSKTQVELAVRELRLFARKEAINELPGCRNTDLYPLFRALTIPNIIILFEYVLAESRIILLSSHTAMLHLVSKAIVELLFPFKWAGVFIPVLPARLIQALEAPCPYICGIERRYEREQFPEDDFVVVDLDSNEIESTALPISIPRQQRRKLMSLLQLAAPHHNRFGVQPGPPLYAAESFPFDYFATENPSIFTASPGTTSLARLVGLNSTSFGTAAFDKPKRPPVFNAFLNAKSDRSQGSDRPRTSSTASKGSGPPSPRESPVSGSFPPLPITPVSRNDSGFALQSSLREKRSGHFDTASNRSGSVGFPQAGRKPSLPFLGHSTNLSVSTLPDLPVMSSYAPSTYAQSTLAASTIMPNLLMQPVRNTESQLWAEGHCLQWQPREDKCTCLICDDSSEKGIYRCSGCGMTAHGRCSQQIYIVCPAAFFPDQIRAAFVRFFASLLYTYRKFMRPADSAQKKNGMLLSFNMDGFLRSLPAENAEYVAMLQQTQAFNEFINDRERNTPTPSTSTLNPTPTSNSIALFDSIILAKRNRGGLRSSLPLNKSIFSSRLSASYNNPFSHSSSATNSDFLSDTSDHLWRSASATYISSSSTKTDLLGTSKDDNRDYRSVVTRAPAKLDPSLMREPRMIQGVPRISEKSRGFVGGGGRKPLPKMMNGLALSPPDAPVHVHQAPVPNGSTTRNGIGNGGASVGPANGNVNGRRPGRLR